MEDVIPYDTLIEKWSPVLEAKGVDPIKDYHRKGVIARILENQDRALQSEQALMQSMLLETPHANAVANNGVANWNPILISLVRRALPNLIAFDIASVQPMTGPTGLIFAMKSRYTAMNGTEAMGLNEVDTDFSGAGTHGGDPSSLPVGGAGTDAGAGGTGTNDKVADNFGNGIGMTTAFGEDLGDAGAGTFNQMAFSIERATVTAKTRALKAEYTMELAQDLKAIHGLDAEAELSNMLTNEILAEINREIIRTINVKAKLGASTANTAVDGIFNLATDADGRWSMEKFKGLVVQLEYEANEIAKETRRGKGNFILCSSNVASSLAAAGMLHYPSDMKADLNVDDTGNTFAGTLNGKIKVYIDPYAGVDYVNVGFRGSSPYDAGMFYCPYVPLTMVRAVDPDTFQPKIAFKTRYGMVTNPFAEAAPKDDTGLNRANPYFRIFRVTNMLVST